MATIGGEAVHDDPDSELAAALLALNAVFVVEHPQETRESPALRFLRGPASDLAGGGILRSVLIPGAPHGAALERAAVFPSALPLVAVAATATFSGDKLARVRLAVTGLATPPARFIEAEAQLERTAGEEDVLDPLSRFGAAALGGAAARATRAAIVNAVSQATGARLHDLPLSPARVLDALTSRARQ